MSASDDLITIYRDRATLAEQKLSAALEVLQLVADWDAKANPDPDPNDDGCEFLNEDGWDEFAEIADRVRAALAMKDSTS